MKNGTVLSVSKRSNHNISKFPQTEIRLLTGLGVEGDAHAGIKVKHRSRVAANPDQLNLRQVHLIHAELFEELINYGFHISPAEMGENITTQGIDLLCLPRYTRLHIGKEAVVEITGLRNPCQQLNGLYEGLLQAVAYKDESGQLIRKAGIMGIVLRGGFVEIGAKIEVQLPKKPYLPLERV